MQMLIKTHSHMLYLKAYMQILTKEDVRSNSSSSSTFDALAVSCCGNLRMVKQT